MKPSIHVPSPLQHWQSLVHGQRFRQLRTTRQSEFHRVGTFHNLPPLRISKDVLTCVKKTCAALGGAGHMTLADWREAEERLKRKLNYEKCNTLPR